MPKRPPLSLPFPDEKSFTCPHCYCYSTMQYRTVGFADDSDAREDGTKNYKKGVIVARCDNCGGKIIWADSCYAYPYTPPEEANEDMPQTVLELYNEAGTIIRQSPRAACALLRLAVERLCNIIIGENRKSLDENIASLSKQGLPEDTIKQLDILRVVGNKAVHPGTIDLSVDNPYVAFQLMRILNSIVQRLITEKKQTDFLYSKIPDSIQEKIIERNNK